jgi:predicted AAA+ superfamily ATPase
MLTPIFEKNGAMENLDRYIKMRGDEVNQKIDQLIDYHESATKFDNQTGEVDNPIYEKQLDKIIKLLNFRKDERLNTYIKDLIKEY